MRARSGPSMPSSNGVIRSMPPASKCRQRLWNGMSQRRVVAPHLVRDVVGGAGEPVRIEDKMRENASLACGKQLVTAFAHGFGAEKRGHHGIRLHRLPAHGSDRARAGD